MTSNQVRCLLMGGQACVFYGAAEFSRDADFAVLAENENLGRLARVMEELQAEAVAVPPFALEYLCRGHAVHFRCWHPEARGLRVDLMSVMRGVDTFADLWQRRTSLELDDGTRIDLLALPDLVKAKKTQRDKDWPMLRRLVEAHYASHHAAPTAEQVRFWLQEGRTPSILRDVARRFPKELAEVLPSRALLALAKNEADLLAALETEEREERERDRLYWLPLRRELEALRHQRRQAVPPAEPNPKESPHDKSAP
jgi:hypothetical protein